MLPVALVPVVVPACPLGFPIVDVEPVVPVVVELVALGVAVVLCGAGAPIVPAWASVPALPEIAPFAPGVGVVPAWAAANAVAKQITVARFRNLFKSAPRLCQPNDWKANCG